MLGMSETAMRTKLDLGFLEETTPISVPALSNWLVSRLARGLSFVLLNIS